jgi:ABC-2 type transport system permease protein
MRTRAAERMRRSRSAPGPYVGAAVAASVRVVRKPAELAVRLLFYVVILIVFAALWPVAVEAAGGRLAGYDAGDLVWYVLAAEGAVIATKPRLIEDIGNDIASGQIAIEMLRPANVVGIRVATELGEALVRLAIAAIMGTAFGFLVVGPPENPAAAALALPSGVLAVGANLAAQHAFAGAAFWLRDARAAWFLYQKLVFLLGGMLLPLQLLPDWLARISWVLPFWTMSYAPARLASGHYEPWLLAAQAAWTLVLAGAAMAVFVAGERRLEVTGG